MKTITTLTKISAALFCVCVITSSNAQIASDDNMLSVNSVVSGDRCDSKNTTGNEKAVSSAKNQVQKSTNTAEIKPITFSAFPDNKDAGLIYLYSNSTCGLIEITDMDGTLVHSEAYENENQMNEPTYIDAPLIPGIYTISFRCENQVVAKQLVIR